MKTLPNVTIKEIADTVLSRTEFTIEQVREGSNKPEITWCVAMISKLAKESGWGYSAIGRYVNRGHDIIMYHCKKGS